eukprot:m.836665 g.836665  ORF g.836665 m.836665 type:complete len:564 (-) comp23458_c0_seq43:359-2050(-)
MLFSTVHVFLMHISNPTFCRQYTNCRYRYRLIWSCCCHLLPCHYGSIMVILKHFLTNKIPNFPDRKCKDHTDAAASEEAEKKALPELAKRFADPKAMEKLKAHKTTHIYFKDDEFVELLKEIQADPKKLKDHLTEPRMMQCVGVLLDMNLVETAANRTLKREELTISSDEEDDTSDDDDFDNSNALPPQPLPVTASEGLPSSVPGWKKLPTTGGSAEAHRDGWDGMDLPSDLPTPLSRATKATDEEKQRIEIERVRAKVAASMGITVEQMDRMMTKVHDTKGEGSAGATTAPTESEAPVGPAPSAAPALPRPQDLVPPQPTVDDNPDTVVLPPAPTDNAERKTLALSMKATATTLYKERKLCSALKCYDYCHTLDPSSMVFRLNAAAVHLQRQAYGECIAAANDAIEIGSVSEDTDTTLLAKAYFRSARAHTALQQFADAVPLYRKALSLNRTKEHLAAKQDNDVRLRAYKKQLAYDPLKAQSCKARGNDLYKKEQFPDAVREYTNAIEHDPDNSALVSACYGRLRTLHQARPDVCQRPLAQREGPDHHGAVAGCGQHVRQSA